MSSFLPMMDAVSWARSKSLEMMEPNGQPAHDSDTRCDLLMRPALLSIGPSA